MPNSVLSLLWNVNSFKFHKALLLNNPFQKPGNVLSAGIPGGLLIEGWPMLLEAEDNIKGSITSLKKWNFINTKEVKWK